MAVVTMNGITFNPTIEVVDGTSLDLTYNDQVVINGISSVVCNFNVSDTGGQSIQEFVVYNGSIEHAGADGVVNIPTAYNGTFTFKITTTEGVVASSSVTVREIKYFPITCGVEVSDVTFTTSTNATIRFRVKGRYYTGSLGIKNNSITMEYSYYLGSTPPSTRTWRTVTPVTSGYDFSANIDIGLTYTDLINFEVRVLDEITNNSATYKYRVTPVFDWSETDFNFNVPVTIGDAYVPSIEVQNTSGIWTYRKWTDGTAECWGIKEVDTAITNATSGWYSSGQLAGTNINYPFTFTSLPTVIASVMPTGDTWAVLFPSNTAGSTSKTGTYQLMSTSKFDASKKYYIAYQVKGKWK